MAKKRPPVDFHLENVLASHLFANVSLPTLNSDRQGSCLIFRRLAQGQWEGVTFFDQFASTLQIDGRTVSSRDTVYNLALFANSLIETLLDDGDRLMSSTYIINIIIKQYWAKHAALCYTRLSTDRLLNVDYPMRTNW